MWGSVMAEPTPKNAARLSQDIGDVLSAIRRLIAEDEALVAARDRLSRDPAPRVIQEDSAEFLARRYGGNAGLARKLAGLSTPSPEANDEWPLGDRANGDQATRPSGTILRHDFAPHPEVAPRHGKPADRLPPLRLGEVDRAEAEPIGARSFDTEHPASRTIPQHLEDHPVVPPSSAARDFESMVDEDDEASFAEAFDWKARMRPEPPAPVRPAGAAKAPDVALAATAPTPLDAATSPARMTPPRSVWAEDDGDVGGQAVADSHPVQPSSPAPDAAATVTGLAPDEEEKAIRDLLREMVQEELHGELGEQFSRNLRAVIRREVAAAIEDQLDRF